MGNCAAVQQALFEEEEQDPATSTQTLSFTDAAEQVLQEQVPPEPLHYREITKIALAKSLLATQGKTPEATMYAQILTEIDRYTKRGIAPRFTKLGQGMVALAGATAGQPKASTWSEADEALLASQRVQPEKLLKAGFHFAHPQLDEALERTLL